MAALHCILGVLALFICVTCGTQYPESEQPPSRCVICEDERQYIGFDGQKWTVLDEVAREHRNEFIPLEAGLTALLTKPGFAINQRALLVESPGGNILWDCIALLDRATVDHVNSLGKLAAIAISHPHYYTTMVEWSRSLGNVPVYLNAADRRHVLRHDECLRFWEGDRLDLHDGLKLVRCGGHFDGGTVLHWPAGAEGRGALLSGDILQVVADRRWVSFMYSYPNLIPLNAAKVQSVVNAVESFEFERVYGAFHPMQVIADGKGAVRRSAERYLRAIS